MPKWRKLGLVHRPDGHCWWARSHALMPTPQIIDERVVRVYFSSLDEQKFGRIGSVDVDAFEPTRVLGQAWEPLLDLGELGSFDDSGVVPSCCVEIDGRRLLYYVGFQRAERVPYMLFTGLAVLESDRQWRRLQRTPVLDRTPEEPYSRSAPFVLPQSAGRFLMWYWSCVRWSDTDRGTHYNNVLKRATSVDGVRWTSDKRPCLEPAVPDEYSLGRPAVVRDGSVFRMWFSARSHHRLYHIGYAESPDGCHWTRKDDEAGIECSESGWDSEMVCYPAIVDVAGKRLMFYNGNRHGATGFGVAVLED